MHLRLQRLAGRAAELLIDALDRHGWYGVNWHMSRASKHVLSKC